MDAIWQHLPSLGIAGLLFVMWWLERQDRAVAAGALEAAGGDTRRLADDNAALRDVLRANTVAVTELRAELMQTRREAGEALRLILERLDALDERN